MSKILCYGSNISTKGIHARAPSAHSPVITYLSGWQMVFRNGYATIIKKEGKKVPCVIWTINDDELGAVDYYEGYPRFYDRINTEHGYVYVMNEPYCNDKIYPSISYIVSLVDGYKEFGISRKYYLEADDEFKEGIE